MEKLHAFASRQVRRCFLRLKNWTIARTAEVRRLTSQTRKTIIAILSAAIVLFVCSVIASSSIRSFCELHPGIILVAIAVAGEVWCDWNRKKSLRELLKKLCGVGLVIGLLIEIGEAIKADKEVAVLNDRAKINEVRVATLSNEAVRLSSDFWAAKSNASIASEAAALAQSNLIAFQEAFKPRSILLHISFDKLKKFSGMEFFIITAGDDESQFFGKELALALEAGGWKKRSDNTTSLLLPTNNPGEFSRMETGVFIDSSDFNARGETNLASEAAEALRTELTKSNIKTTKRSLHLNVRTVRIVVGPVPKTPHGE